MQIKEKEQTFRYLNNVIVIQKRRLGITVVIRL